MDNNSILRLSNESFEEPTLLTIRKIFIVSIQLNSTL